MSLLVWYSHKSADTGAALLTDAKLFGHPLSSNPRWLAIMLEKSGNLPLDVKYNAPVVLRGAKPLGSLNKLFGANPFAPTVNQISPNARITTCGYLPHHLIVVIASCTVARIFQPDQFFPALSPSAPYQATPFKDKHHYFGVLSLGVFLYAGPGQLMYSGFNF
jgi:hypothetical protein